MHLSTALLKNLIFYAGIGHIALSLGSLAIPRALKWKEGLGVLQPLLKQMFWTYAGYILAINLFFGVVSIAVPNEMINHTGLATGLTFFIGLYWLARIVIQFFYFDKTNAPKGLIFTLGETGLVLLFAAFTVIYFVAFWYNIP